MDESPRRPWFGPKRIGYGIRPRTWQGWALTVIFTALVVAAVMLLKH